MSEVLGGDKPRRYFLGRDSSVGVGFIPGRKGFNVDFSAIEMNVSAAHNDNELKELAMISSCGERE